MGIESVTNFLDKLVAGKVEVGWRGDRWRNSCTSVRSASSVKIEDVTVLVLIDPVGWV